MARTPGSPMMGAEIGLSKTSHSDHHYGSDQGRCRQRGKNTRFNSRDDR